jgi:hypothetical protein
VFKSSAFVRAKVLSSGILVSLTTRFSQWDVESTRFLFLEVANGKKACHKALLRRG